MSDENISSDFKRLGENLTSMLKAAWDRPERKSIQSEIEAGLNELGTALDKAVQDFSESESGQKMKAQVDDLRNRVESGEVEATVRDEVKSALRTVNEELESLVEKMRKPE